MEFILHLPQDIDKNGAFWQLWDSFNEKFKNCQNIDIGGTSETDTLSLLLLAAPHQVKTVCSSLKIYNLDLPTLKKVLEVVEQACLPYFILLFERFRYFSLKKDQSDSVNEFVITQQKQAEICEFSNQENNILSNSYSNSQQLDSTKDEKLSCVVMNLPETAVMSLGYSSIEADNEDIFESFSFTESLNNTECLTNTESLTNTGKANHKLNRRGNVPVSKEGKRKHSLLDKLKRTKMETRKKPKKTKKFEDFYSENSKLLSRKKKLENNKPLLVSKKLHTNSNMTSHFAIKRTKSSILKQFCCCFCAKSFYGEHCLRKHLALKHAGHSDYPCITCKVVLSSLEKYLLHCKMEHVNKKRKPQASTKFPASTVKLNETPLLENGEVAYEPVKNLKDNKINKPSMHDSAENVSLGAGEVPPDFSPSENNTDSNSGSAKSCKKIKTECNTKFDFPKKLKQFPCCFCKKSFFGENCTVKHFTLKHAGSSEYPCRICGTSFSAMGDYLVHCQNEHVVEKVGFQCWSCGDLLKDLSEYKQHNEKHNVDKKFSCDLCLAECPSIFQLIGHLRNHLMAQNKCEICGVVFIKPKSYIKHKERHNQPGYDCKICGKFYPMRYRLEDHMKSHRGEKTFTCELCGKSYSNKPNLIHHKRWHAGEKPYVCDICGARFRCSGDMSKHKKKHANLRTYVCEICGRGFNFNSALAKHRDGHTGKRAYACDVCGRTFIYREGLRDHIKANRCPGKGKDSASSETKRAARVLEVELSGDMEEDEAKVFEHVLSRRASGRTPKHNQDWQYVIIRHDDPSTETSVVLIPPM